jgi:hypothetical protein
MIGGTKAEIWKSGGAIAILFASGMLPAMMPGWHGMKNRLVVKEVSSIDI